MLTFAHSHAQLHCLKSSGANWAHYTFPTISESNDSLFLLQHFNNTTELHISTDLPNLSNNQGPEQKISSFCSTYLQFSISAWNWSINVARTHDPRGCVFFRYLSFNISLKWCSLKARPRLTVEMWILHWNEDGFDPKYFCLASFFKVAALNRQNIGNIFLSLQKSKDHWLWSLSIQWNCDFCQLMILTHNICPRSPGHCRNLYHHPTTRDCNDLTIGWQN